MKPYARTQTRKGSGVKFHVIGNANGRGLTAWVGRRQAPAPSCRKPCSERDACWAPARAESFLRRRSALCSEGNVADRDDLRGPLALIAATAKPDLI